MSDTRGPRLLRRLARAWAAQVRAHEVLEDRLRPWEDDRVLTVDHDEVVAPTLERL